MVNNKITSIRCPLCNRVFMLTAISRSCVCGWSVDTPNLIDTKKKVEMNNNNMVNKPIVITQPRSNDAWEVEIDIITECSKVPKVKDVFIELLAKRKIDLLMKKFPNIEWLAYLLGDKEDPYTVKDIFIPKQVVTATSVNNIVCPEWNQLPVIGVIHSHHGMGNGFSGTDHEWINQNHDISLCIAKTGIAGQVRMKTPCGSLKIVSAKVIVKFPKIDYDFKEWLAESIDKIETKTYQPYQTYFGALDDKIGFRNEEKKIQNIISTAEIMQRNINKFEERGKIDEEQSLMDALNELDNVVNHHQV